jgi:hypothetical protein
MFTKPILKAPSLLTLLPMAIIVATSLGWPQSTLAQQEDVQAKYPAETQQNINPDPPEALTQSHPEISQVQYQQLDESRYELRKKMAANIDQNPPSARSALPPVVGTESFAGQSASLFHGTPSDFIFGRNNQNTRANIANGSTLAEPSAANDGRHIFAAGNLRHAEFSTNGGVTWTNVAIPVGPADAPTAFGDTDVIYDEARGVIFYSQLYVDATTSPPINGVVRIFVRRTVPGGTACSYTIDPAGASNNTLPDYPHLHKSNNNLYLSMNLLGGVVGGRARIHRLNIDNMADCVTAAGSLIDITWASLGGQRVLTPVEGARERMYWATLIDASTLRIYHWDDDSGTVFSNDRSVSSSNFGDVDCSGGTGNNDWWDNLMANIIGFNMRGVVGAGRISFYWNVAPDTNHAQGHIHGAIFGESDFDLITQPVIFNNDFCFGNAVVSANDRGDVGMVLAFGGNKGGGGAAAQPAVGMDDDFTPGIGNFGAGGGFNFNPTAIGTHNRPDARYGDYFVIHRQTPCGLFFETTSYALNGGTAVANVDSRYTEFGRNRDAKCYFGWSNAVRQP